MTELAADLGSAKESLQNPRSLVEPNGTIPRDFPVTFRPAAAKGMNVLFIQMESTSAAHLDEKTTPNLMRLAQSALSFRNHATVFSETSRSSYGIYFSDYMTDLGTTPRLLYQRPMPRQSLAGVLKQAGYATAAIHSGFLSYADLRYLYEGTGFDTVIDATNLWNGEEELPWSWGVREEQTVDAIVKWLEQPRQQPFFLLYATEFPHHPYTCPIEDPPYEPTNWVNRYRNSLYYADKCIGTLLERLRSMNLLDNTIIVVTGDHGETVSTYPVGHGVAVSREELFTPFIVSNPKLFPSAQHSSLVTNHLDIAPTLTKLLGLTPPADWLGRDVFADEIPARLLFMQAKLARVQAVLDNGVVSVYECARQRSKLYDISNGGFEPIGDSDPRIALSSSYRQQNELFQKWAVWRHMARAAGTSEIITASTPRAEAARPAAARFERSSSAAP
jgi:phosphoglycerol transferase MdoB-like AlkP superfamily enzyme